MSVTQRAEVKEIPVEVPIGTDPDVLRDFLRRALASSSAVERVATALMHEGAEVGPATAAQLAQVEHLWRHLIETYGVYTSADIAKLRGGDPGNRSTASNLAKKQGLIGFRRGNAKVYPIFEFKGSTAHPRWTDIAGPLKAAGWEGEDVLLFLVSPHPALDGNEPAALIDTPEVDRVVSVVEREAQGVW